MKNLIALTLTVAGITFGYLFYTILIIIAILISSKVVSIMRKYNLNDHGRVIRNLKTKTPPRRLEYNGVNW